MDKKVTISGHLNSSINFSMQQNYVPVIKSLVVHNESEFALENLQLRISFEPEFAYDFSYDIERLEAGESMEIRPVEIKLSTEYLYSLTEKMVGNIFIELYEGETKLYDYNNTIELLAHDQWSGLLIMPELITAFVTPNHPRVTEVLTKAVQNLELWSKNPSFTGYQTQNPNNDKLQMAAIYAALQSKGISYITPPSSYEVLGQRVRLPYVVMENRQGTCLDLSVLYAACLEAVGLNPLLVFTKGHCFAGCWLEQQTFADCVVDDVSAIEKRIVPGTQEILLVECVDFVAGKNVDFDRAIKHANDYFINPLDFSLVVDVKRTRGSGIRPIPVRLSQSEFYISGENQFAENETVAPEELNIVEMADLSQVEENITKQKVWERKLLDFSLRNALLNFRPNKNSLQLMTADLGELEDKLTEGTDFRIMAAPTEWTLSPRDAKMYEIENNKDLISSIATEEFKNNRIRTFIQEEELTKNLKGIYRAAKVSMEENGTNTLFLALGFLRWFETDISEKARYAPIVLVPVDIVKSVRNKGYVLRSRQEDAQINITLLEYLRQIYGVKITGLDPLPHDEHGIDLPLVFHTIRQAIMGNKRWNIENLAFVGLFSFGQFVMWNDIRNRSEDLEKNKVVSSLIEGKMNWTPEENLITLENLDEMIEPSKMAVPMSADSSQMVAIAAAAAGQSFVLHGPPGTGKSQTITNMIANALYQGKSVLFVAEKMAALNVVQNRLAGIGLDPFCLELHSNKTSKSNVLSQLNQALEVGRIKAPEEYQATADKIYEMRKELNSVIEALHCRREYGCSLYEAIEKFEACKDNKGLVDFDKAYVDILTEAKINELYEVLRQYIVSIKDVSVFNENPLHGYEGMEYSIELRSQFEKQTGELIEKCETVSSIFDRLSNWTTVNQDRTKYFLSELITVGKLAGNKAPTLKELIKATNFKDLHAKLKDLCQAGDSYKDSHAALSTVFEEQVFGYNADDALLRLKQAEMSWFLPKLTGTNKLVKELRLYAKNPDSVEKENLQNYLQKLSYVSSLKAKFEQVPAELTKYLEGLYLGLDSDWSLIYDALEKAVQVNEFIANVDKEKQQAYVDAAADSSQEKELGENIEYISAFLKQVAEWKGTYHINMEDSDLSRDWIGDLKGRFERYVQNITGLKTWVTMNQKADRMKKVGLENIVAAWEKGSVNTENVQSVFECNLYYALVLKTLGEDGRLSDFQGNQYEDQIAKYGELIEKFRVLTIQELVAKLSAQIPVTGTAGAASSEIGILKKAIKSNGRMLSIRRLFDQIPTLLRRLCPCMLMSPISVAQYIDPAFPKFDLVIFDEASQLPTSEAVGTIARGENVVVVGDPKQLPPTSFFSSNFVDEDNVEMEDLESLLDDCLSISMPQEHLKWHYRSRHESLIAYSNMKYYDNKLYTFPSPNDLVSEVKLVHVDGYYDKGKTKQNMAEAKAVVAEIIRRLSDEKLRNDSIGVVTFSSVQQHLIDDMLAAEFVKHPELEDFDRKANEPIFIKNLENVQGDERDVILFSIGYGPDKDGKISMNFGPLNREGGWRRLNVAISRARKSMIVYSTLRPEQIDLSRTRAEGLEGLRGFLEFADRGKNVLAVKAGTATKQVDPLVLQLAEAIKGMGYDVKCNIGCSEYKMDIGIVNSEKPDTYLLGILLDGENCKEAATSRDRFILQPSVLRGLGWKIMRVWTLDWLDNPENVLKEIKKELEKGSEVPEEAVEQTNAASEEEIVFEKMDISECETVKSVKMPYETARFQSVGLSEEFYDPHSITTIIDAAEKILEIEAPVSKETLAKRVLEAWWITRTGSKAEAVLEIVFERVRKNETKDMDTIFYWRADQNPDTYEGYRVEDQFLNKRSMDDIPSQEIINAIKEVLMEQISVSRADLIRETAKKFGFSRLGNVIETTISHAIKCGEDRGIIIVTDDDRIILG